MKDRVRGMIKRIACTLTAVFLMLCCVSCARTQEEPSGARPGQELVSTVTDMRELAMIAERDNIDAPPGYRLEKVETYTLPSGGLPDLQVAWPYALLYEVGESSGSSFGFYDKRQYDSDWYEGPCEVSVNFTGPVQAWVDAETRVARAVMAPYDGTVEFSTSVPAGKFVNIRIYNMYGTAQFKVRNRLTRNTVEQDAWMAILSGRVVVQYTYGGLDG